MLNQYKFKELLAKIQKIDKILTDPEMNLKMSVHTRRQLYRRKAGLELLMKNELDERYGVIL